MFVYGLISDSGDGSSCLQLFSNKELVDYLLGTEEYYINEGVQAITINVPDGMDPKDLWLFDVSHQTLESYKQSLDE